ncbi:N-formylglutamate amidohydrolase [Actinoplanes sp. CA-015351]|uniref:N-formylglutamate amidohydrolase n=1 Tax=Actinoplanes sp. CA-015351 TaxID=3239897 RepID=UPI003D96D8CE
MFDLIPGDPDSPVILHVPHASREIISSGLVIGPGEIAEELDHLTDAWTDVIATRAFSVAARRPWMLINRLSRLVVDPERFLGDSEEMLAAGMGPVYTHGHSGRRLRTDDPARDATLLEDHFIPYAETMTNLVAGRLSSTGRAVILDVHSYSTALLAYELHRDGPRPPVCLGTDEFHTPGWLVEAARSVFDGTGLNSPFAGCYVPLDHWRRDPAVSALMIEIRRDQYMREPGGAILAGPDGTAGLDTLARSLAALVDAVP